jgi:hypothetical protein
MRQSQQQWVVPVIRHKLNADRQLLGFRVAHGEGHSGKSFKVKDSAKMRDDVDVPELLAFANDSYLQG